MEDGKISGPHNFFRQHGVVGLSAKLGQDAVLLAEDVRLKAP